MTLQKVLMPSLLVMACHACGAGADDQNGNNQGDPDSGTAPGAIDAAPGAIDAAPSVDAAGLAACVTPTDLGRGQQWVRDNEIFVSALKVQQPSPSSQEVSDYFDSFHANAAHLWIDGLSASAGAWSAAGKRFVAWTDSDGEATNGMVLGGAQGVNLPGRIGYQIGDEPRSMAAYLEIEDAIDVIRSADPEALLIVNFTYQADEIDQFLAAYGANVDGDVISYDRYSRSSSAYVTKEKFRAAGLAHDKPYWTYLRSYYGPGEGSSSASDMRWDAYTHMAYGYTGFTWFVYQILNTNDPHIGGVSFFASPGTLSATKTSAFALAGQLNQEIQVLGRTLTQLTSTDVRYNAFNGLAQPEGTQSWSEGAGGDPYLTGVNQQGALSESLIGFFTDDCAEQYFLVQNPNHSGGSFPVDNESDLTIALDFDFSGAPASTARTHVLALDEVTGETKQIPLTSSGSETKGLSVTLPAGHGMLIKYDTGRPFVLQPE